MDRRQFIVAAAAAGLGWRSPPAFADPGYQTVTYRSGPLGIEAYLFKPAGDGPFPLLIYNHGTRAGHVKDEVPMRFVAAPLRDAGYAVLAPERRGYGKSDGTAAGGRDPVAALEGESDDVLAGLAYARALPFIDGQRVGIMGASFGGIVTMFTAAKSDGFRCAIDQAGGELSWKASPAVRKALVAAAGKVRIPVLFMDSENDATTEGVKACADAMQRAGVAHELKIYPAFTPSQNPEHIAPGHLIFGLEGVNIWIADAVAFLRTHLAPA